MILWKFKEEPETRGDNYPCSAFRWTFQIRKWGLGFIHQHKFKKTGEWKSSHTRLYMVNISKYLRLGSEHWWYDGPHCFFSIGFIHFNWGGWRGSCDKCER